MDTSTRQFDWQYKMGCILPVFTRRSSVHPSSELPSSFIMTKYSLTLAALGLAGFSAASICNNNCGRQVIGTAIVPGKLPVESRQAMCSSFLATTITVTPGYDLACSMTAVCLLC